jgi:hypothetical protein
MYIASGSAPPKGKFWVRLLWYLFCFVRIHDDYVCVFVSGEQPEWMGVAGGPLLLTKTLCQLRCGAEADLPQVSFPCSTVEKPDHDVVKTVREAAKVNYANARSEIEAHKVFIRRWLFFEALGLILRFCVHGVLEFSKQTCLWYCSW